MSIIRLKKVESLLREKICDLIIKNKIKDPRIDKLLSITDVSVSKDINYAKIYVSYYGAKEKAQEIIAALNHAAGFIQKKIGTSLRLKATPKLTFFHDESIARGFRITHKLKEILPK